MTFEAQVIQVIPGWVWLMFIIFSIGIFSSKFKQKSKSSYFINPQFFLLLLGSLMPVFDDLLGFVFGYPFSHHSLFHSFLGIILTPVIFTILFDIKNSFYAFTGNAVHVIYNFLLDWTTLFFPFYMEDIGLTHLIGFTTAQIKAVTYPIILLIFIFASLFYLKKSLRPSFKVMK